MPPAPIPEHEADRLEALLCCNILDTEPEAEFDDITALAARLTGCPMAVISLVDEDRQWFKSTVGLDVCQTPRDHAFCGYVVYSNEPLIVEDAAIDPRTADNPLVTGDPGLRFYAGVPLFMPNGTSAGTLCVLDTKPRVCPPTMLGDILALGRQATAQLHLRYRFGEIQRANTQLTRESEAKTRFLANVSHEIRTPMTAILGYTDLLDATAEAGREVLNDPDWLEHAVESIRVNANHLMTVIDDIHDGAKIDAGVLELRHEDSDLPALLEDIAGLHDGFASRKGLAFELRYTNPIPRRINTDPTRLRQILLNLIGNAIKFTEEGSITLTVSYDEPAGVTFAVTDTGCGIPADRLEFVRRFEPFSQADQSPTRRFGGTGLGLNISNALVALLSGEDPQQSGTLISVDSEEGRGSTFSFTIPADPDRKPATDLVYPGAEGSHAPAAPEPAERRPAGEPITPAAASPGPKPLEGLRILLAEDGFDNRRLVTFHLTRNGAKVTQVTNGQDAVTGALDALHHGPFDVILMDMQMPVTDGYEATRMLRQMAYDRPIVALTANALAEDRQKCLDAGCDEYLSKPIDVEALLGTILHFARGEGRRLSA